MTRRWWHFVNEGAGLPWWFPLPWLVYLLPLGFGPYYTHAAPATWIAVILGMLLGAALFLRGFRARGWESVAIVAMLFALGCAFGSFNQDASVFFVFGAAAIGICNSSMFLREILGYCASIIVAAIVLHLFLPVWTVGVTLSLAVGFAVSKSVEHRRLHHELLRAREEVEQLAKVAERERIARDLHDVLGHTLTVIAIKSELASRLADRDPVRAASEIRDVERIARESLQELRATVTGYRNAGILAEIESARSFLEDAGLRVETEIASVRMESRKEAALALALREAVTNIVRHAHAKNVCLRLRNEADAYWLEVVDDGVGGAVTEGNGLAGMRERVEACGGRVIRSGGLGTSLAVTIPAAEDTR
jgi:two-component system, NarL family, sensor histidine kinase DesK